MFEIGMYERRRGKKEGGCKKSGAIESNESCLECRDTLLFSPSLHVALWMPQFLQLYYPWS
jgi:hypothetical protein